MVQLRVPIALEWVGKKLIIRLDGFYIQGISELCFGVTVFTLVSLVVPGSFSLGKNPYVSGINPQG